jgi:hypothetical protein
MSKLLRLTAAVILVCSLAAAPAAAQIPDPPPPPEELQPLANVVSPLSFQACLAPSVAIGLVQAGDALAPGGLPVQPNTVLNPVLNVLLLDLVCSYFTPKIVPPTCGVDTTVFESLPANAFNVPQPASIAATEAKAIEEALAAYGAPSDQQLSDPVYAQLGCED